MIASTPEHEPRVPYGFEEFERRAVARRARARRRARTLSGAWAASLLVIVLLAWQGTRDSAEPPASAPGNEPPALADEWLLSGLEPAASRVQVETRLASVAIEQQIALIDDLLSDARVGSDPLLKLRRLEDERARLVDSLVRVRHAEALILDAR